MADKLMHLIHIHILFVCQSHADRHTLAHVYTQVPVETQVRLLDIDMILAPAYHCTMHIKSPLHCYYRCVFFTWIAVAAAAPAQINRRCSSNNKINNHDHHYHHDYY